MPAEPFDVISAMDVFEHLLDSAAAIDRIADVLTPGSPLPCLQPSWMPCALRT